MFPSRFDFVAARSVDEAVAAKAEGGGDTRILAGGQSLLPMMKIRLASPERLIDINNIPGLDFIERDDGYLKFGALARHEALRPPPPELRVGARARPADLRPA